jgi:hypothetical protein
LENEVLCNKDVEFALELTFKSEKWVIRRKLSDIILFLNCNIEVSTNFTTPIETYRVLVEKEYQEIVTVANLYVKEISEHFISLYNQSIVFFDVHAKGVGEDYVSKSVIVPKLRSCIRCSYMSATIYFTIPSTKGNLEDWKRYYVVMSDCISYYENEVTFRNLGQPEYQIQLEYFTFLAARDKNEFKVVTDTAVLCFRVSPDEFSGWENIFSILPEIL